MILFIFIIYLKYNYLLRITKYTIEHILLTVKRTKGVRRAMIKSSYFIPIKS